MSSHVSLLLLGTLCQRSKKSSQFKLKDWKTTVNATINSVLSFRIIPSSSQILFRLKVIMRSDFFFFFENLESPEKENWENLFITI